MKGDHRPQPPPIRDYGYIGDCHSSALISIHGSIDWCCMPIIDSPSCFGRLLDWQKGGYCQIVPNSEFTSSRKYLDNTMILVTQFETETGKAQIFDFFPMREKGEHQPYQQILRIVEGLEGNIVFKSEIQPRFDYGSIKPWIRPYNENSFVAIGGDNGLLMCGDMPLWMRSRHEIYAEFNLIKGQRAHLALIYRKPEEFDEESVEAPSISEIDSRLEETIRWWETWVRKGRFSNVHLPDLVIRSALVLKSLSNAPTGAIAAAPTTSLPESIGGSRNWDYRYSWVRDSFFSVISLTRLGFVSEADGFRRFMQRTSAGSAEELQVVYGVTGQRHLFEFELDYLDGYRGSKPVRIGNAAEQQLQFDVYGELLALAWNWYQQGNVLDRDYWWFLVEIVNTAVDNWESPDRGIWEIRGEPRHFVFSKAMCWIAIYHGINLSEELGMPAPLKKWRDALKAIEEAINTRGYDADRGVFIQAFDWPQMDASLLLLASFGFIDYKDPRMVRTTNAIIQDLTMNGLILRYPLVSDNLEGGEGVFLACSFWMATILARQGRLEEALQFFNRAASAGNDLGLFSEEYDCATGEMLGNFPQALTHLSLITAALSLKNPKFPRIL